MSESDAANAAETHVQSDHYCHRCSYALRGLPISGKCPECGTPVADSLKGYLLQNAAPEFLAAIGLGLSLVLNGLLLSIALGLAMGMLGFVLGPVRRAEFVLMSQGVQLLIQGMMFFGYWKYTSPDPGFVAFEQPTTARNVVRWALYVQIAFTCASIVVGQLTSDHVIVFALALGAYLVWGLQFFSVMRYTLWISGRIPDVYVTGRARRYLWLLPVLSTLGVVCVGLGPLIAMILYWNLLDRVRKHVKSIRSTGAPADLPGRIAKA